MEYIFTKPYAEKELYYLDVGTISDNEYDLLKPIVEHLGGHWREKTKCFIFYKNVKDTLDYYVANGVTPTEQYLWQEETQYYPTPVEVANRVVELAEITEGCSVLEPSAGRGNLLDCIGVKCDILAIEPLSENCKYLESKGYNYGITTFEKAYKTLPNFNRVVMNPPFSGQRDIKHVMMAYSLLNPEGVLVSVMSENALYYETEISADFRAFLKKNKAYVEAVPALSFAENGTTIETVIVTIKKNKGVD